MKNLLLTVSSFRKSLSNSYFEVAYNKLISNRSSELSQDEKLYLLKTAIVLLNEADFSLERLGYRIILSYCNAFHNYIPLYDVSLSKGYIPISKFIELNLLNGDKFGNHFFNTLLSSYKENFLQNGIYLSEGQQDLIRFANSNEGDFVLIAPTSYGKSDIIVSKAQNNISKRVCIVVPSKSLLAQTKRRLLKRLSNNASNKLITHPDMYLGNEANFIAILTQERLLRLIQKHPDFTLDLLLVDEAHNLLKGDSRAIFISSGLIHY
ncbi:DEAD/DEAH box helicase family protein [Hymenobacter negativus]|uniref:DEAD/DEAH box helicase family protein n=1 Tax=Hymenobacter negativus TaxID=2795026 RepID=A0ABS3QIE8_9BACT|nr:DEAD/DEAH box helicase family protein [Hymenobacter negativus]MBO2011015.1 DEAD/DEAH box helicase family protein [Hymenobacter negativus]